MDEQNIGNEKHSEYEGSFLPDFLVESIVADRKTKKIEARSEKPCKIPSKAYCPECDDWINLEEVLYAHCPKCSAMLEDKIMKSYTYKENPQFVVTRGTPRSSERRSSGPDCPESSVEFNKKKCVKPFSKFVRFDDEGNEVREIVSVPCEFNQGSRCGITAKGRYKMCRRHKEGKI